MTPQDLRQAIAKQCGFPSVDDQEAYWRDKHEREQIADTNWQAERDNDLRWEAIQSEVEDQRLGNHYE